MYLGISRVRSLIPKVPSAQADIPSIHPNPALQQFGIKLLDVLVLLLNKSTSIKLPGPNRNLPTDHWGFGYVWNEIQERCEGPEELYQMLRDRKAEILEIRELVRPTLKPIKELETFPQGLLSNTVIVDPSRLSAISDGCSGSYFLLGENNEPIFVVKPIDEDIGAINNQKGHASPFRSSRMREGLPLYRSVFREVATYRVAQIIGATSVAPKTALAILQSDHFFDLSKQVRSTELRRFTEFLGPPDQEKLCSVQTFIPQSKPLFEALQDLQVAGLSDEEIGKAIDQNDFEEANLLLWTTGDGDGHLGNFLVYPKSHDEIGNQILGIKKIDNGMAFLESNHSLHNSLAHLPNAKSSLSQKTIAKIQRLDPDKIASTLRDNGLEGAIPAMKIRIEMLQSLVAENHSLSIKEINNELCQRPK